MKQKYEVINLTVNNCSACGKNHSNAQRFEPISSGATGDGYTHQSKCPETNIWVFAKEV